MSPTTLATLNHPAHARRAPLCAVQPGAAQSAALVDASPPLSALIDAKLAADREIQRLSARVRELAIQVARADERARRALAQDLHDDAGPALTAARFAVARIETWLPADVPATCAEALLLAKQSLDEACEASHRAVAGLHGPRFEHGAGSTLADWIDRFAAHTGLRVTLDRPADEQLACLPDDTALAMFRVTQEALNNVARHARATAARVVISLDAQALTLVIEDDGVGIAAAARRKTGRFGISGMRSRCDALGGSLRVAVARTGGTSVRARFPWSVPYDAAPALHAVNS
jgi:signal transduction histidine kinase